LFEKCELLRNENLMVWVWVINFFYFKNQKNEQQTNFEKFIIITIELFNIIHSIKDYNIMKSTIWFVCAAAANVV